MINLVGRISLFPATSMHIFMKQTVFLIVVITLLYSCKGPSGTDHWKTTEDTLSIPAALLNATFNVKKDASERPLFQSYDKSLNEIVLIDLDSEKQIFSVTPAIDFEKSGRLIQFDVYKADSVFVVTEDYVYIVNATGEIIYSKDLSTPLKDQAGNDLILWDNDNQFPLFYNSQTKELLIRTTCNCSYMDAEYFKHKLEGWLNLETGTIRQLNYSFPQNHTEFSYSQSVFPYRILTDSLSVISFQSQDSLYVYDRSTDSMKRYTGRSKYQTVDFIPFDTANKGDMERVKEFLTVSPIYQRILYDPYRQIYYRFFVKEQPLKNENGVYNTIFTKDVILMVFDKDFHIIEEKNIGNNYSWYFSFVTPNGLYVRKYDTDKPSKKINDYAKFTVFTWN